MKPSVLALFTGVALAFVPCAYPRQDHGGDDSGSDHSAALDRSRGRDRTKIKPYDSVITDKATTKAGVFLVHELDEKLYYEIPTSEFDKEFLWVTQIAKTQSGFGFGGTGAGDRVVRWQLRDKKVLLRDVKYELRARDGDAIQRSVAATSVEPIIETFDVLAWGKDQAPVIEVTDLFRGDVNEFSVRRRLNASSLDRAKTFIEQTKVFPTNIETKVLATYKLSREAPTSGFGRRSSRRDPSQSVVTAEVHHSMVRLPDEPMKPRVHDSRVGFFSVSFEEYGTDEHQVEEMRYVTRWRLEKKDEAAEVSEPKKPIVFYVGREVPEKWRPWVKKGIEAWQPAFEAAGFKNAILAKDAPSEREDPNWDAEDARYSSIRWLPATIENAMGPHVNDPRTGEILEADILVYHNILKLVRDWYFVQASPSDERAQSLPMPDDLIGELLAYVITHEVGHSLGFPHNMKASSCYSVEQLRDPAFTAAHGTEASIMDYGRFNYVAQPGDGAALIPVVGPYDFFAVDWGYREFATAQAEQDGLRTLVKKQVDDPMLRFGDSNPDEDPSQQTEDLGSDPIAATALGLKNVERVAGFLVSATCREGDDYDLLRNMYGELLGQRGRELGHVVNVVAGMVANNVWYGDGDRVYEPVAPDRQREAVRFLIEHAFHVPDALLQPAIVDRLESHGAADRILREQERVLGGLINTTRVRRMAEHADRAGESAYFPAEMLADVREGIWTELDDPRPTVGLHRRNLQRAHVDTLSKNVDQLDVDSDLPALCRGELETILGAVRRATARSGDETTNFHLADLAARIDNVLEPRSVRSLDQPAPTGPAASSRSAQTPGVEGEER